MHSSGKGKVLSQPQLPKDRKRRKTTDKERERGCVEEKGGKWRRKATDYVGIVNSACFSVYVQTKEPLSIETSWQDLGKEPSSSRSPPSAIENAFFHLRLGKFCFLVEKFSPFASFLPTLFSYECFQSRGFPSIPHKQFHKILSIGTNLFPKCQLQRNNFLFGDTIHTDRHRERATGLAWLDFPLTLSANFFFCDSFWSSFPVRRITE